MLRSCVGTKLKKEPWVKTDLKSTWGLRGRRSATSWFHTSDKTLSLAFVAVTKFVGLTDLVARPGDQEYLRHNGIGVFGCPTSVT